MIERALLQGMMIVHPAMLAKEISHAGKGLNIDFPFWARSGNQWKKLLFANPIDLVVVDLNLPRGDGVEIIKELKLLNDSLRVVLMNPYSGSFGNRICQEAFRARADAVIFRPASQKKIQSILANFLPK